MLVALLAGAHVQSSDADSLDSTSDTAKFWPLPFIVDTDIGCGGCRDVDDVVSVCIANAMADRGEIDLIAVVQNTLNPSGVGVISALNNYYGRPDVRIGTYQGGDLADNVKLSYVDKVISLAPGDVKNASMVDDSVTVYRKALASQDDGTVVIASIGPLTNLKDLFNSQGDDISPDDGKTLFQKKVKRIGFMGGRYPSSAGHDCECNLCAAFNGAIDQKKTSQISADVVNALSNMSNVEMQWGGFEVGFEVLTGARLSKCAPTNNPCRQAMIDFEGGEDKGRFSWDPLATLIAVRGPEAAGCETCKNCDGVNSVTAKDGSNKWVPRPNGTSQQSYYTLKDKAKAMNAIDDLLCVPPANSPENAAAWRSSSSAKGKSNTAGNRQLTPPSSDEDGTADDDEGDDNGSHTNKYSDSKYVGDYSDVASENAQQHRLLKRSAEEDTEN